MIRSNEEWIHFQEKCPSISILSLSEKGSNQSGEFASKFLSEQTPFQKEDKNNFELSPMKESAFVSLKGTRTKQTCMNLNKQTSEHLP